MTVPKIGTPVDCATCGLRFHTEVGITIYMMQNDPDSVYCSMTCLPDSGNLTEPPMPE